MASYNRVVLMGNVTRNPEVRSIPGSSTAVARTGLAVNRRYKDKEDVMFIDIVAFGKSAETMGEYVIKGTPILVEGRLSMNTWEQDGVRRTKHEVIIDNFQMLGGRRDREEAFDNDSFSRGSSRDEAGHYGSKSNPSQSSGVDEAPSQSSDSIDEDDVPF